MPSRVVLFKNVVRLYVFLFVVWGFYRLLFRLPEVVEESLLKPIIWLVPLVWLLYQEKADLKSIGWSAENLFKNLRLGVGLGFSFCLLALLANFVKYRGFSFDHLVIPNGEVLLLTLGLSLATAISEETVFRGYLFHRLWHVLGDEWTANLFSSFAWALIHLPITLFILHYNFVQILAYLFLSFVFGVGSAFIFARTRTVAASVLLHIFWSWPIVLFR